MAALLLAWVLKDSDTGTDLVDRIIDLLVSLYLLLAIPLPFCTSASYIIHAHSLFLLTERSAIVRHDYEFFSPVPQPHNSYVVSVVNNIMRQNFDRKSESSSYYFLRSFQWMKAATQTTLLI